jgi:hypothetical protein
MDKRIHEMRLADERDRVTIRNRGCDDATADKAAGTRPIVGNNLLAILLAQLLRIGFSGNLSAANALADINNAAASVTGKKFRFMILLICSSEVVCFVSFASRSYERGSQSGRIRPQCAVPCA